MKFEVGQEVRVISEESDGKNLKGKIGKIVSAQTCEGKWYNSYEKYGVEFKINIDGHNCRGLSKEGHGWFLTEDKLESVEIIETNDEWVHDDVESIRNLENTVIVTLNDGSIGKSMCHPRDTFNLTEGYLLAYSRAKIESHNRSMEKYYRIEELMGGKIHD